MARNKLTDLNDHLFAQIERLTDESEPIEDLEIKRSEAIAKLADQVVKTHRLVLDAVRLMSQDGIKNNTLPDTFGIKQIEAPKEE